ncbi:hypothetical protein SLS53_006028 [Cytospora paraplurivora]|uniref:Uncharacterized protein n=1 Tax=Cytospora paraplurivora TaxID=2898453 RepID=A0AAN9YFJ0_9PEZI
MRQPEAPAREPKNKRKPTTATTIPEARPCRAPHRPAIPRGDKAISTHPLVGKYCVEITSSERRWYGKYALDISTEAQLGVRLTVEGFDSIFAGEEINGFNETNDWTGDYNSYDEQLDLVLRLWGLWRGLGRLQLGVIRDFEGVFIDHCVPAGMSWGNEG